MATKKTKERAYRRLSATEWAEARSLYELGTATVDEIAVKFGVRRDTISKKFAKEGVKKGSRAAEHAEKISETVAAAAAKTAAEATVLSAKRIIETKDTYFRAFDWLTKLSVKTVQDAISGGRGVESAMPALKTFEKLTNILTSHRQEKYALLGLDKDEVPDGDLPTLLVEEISDGEARDMAQKKGLNFDDPFDAMPEEQISEEGDAGTDE
jgi:hypothetical protein